MADENLIDFIAEQLYRNRFAEEGFKNSRGKSWREMKIVDPRFAHAYQENARIALQAVRDFRGQP